MTDERETRKRQFRAALGLAGLTAQQWAEKEGVNPGYLSRVLSGKIKQSWVVDRIDEFARKRLAAA